MSIASTGSSAAAGVVDNDHYLRTDALRADLDRRAARGGTTALLGSWLQWMLNVTATVVLARLLRPEDFGLLAMVGVVSGFLANFIDAGLSTATIQKPVLEQDQISGLFWVNLRLTISNATLLALSAPLLVWFYDEPALLGITLVLAAGVLAIGVSVLHIGLLRRQMRFGLLSVIDLSATALSAGAAIVAAMRGAGYWALVIQQVLQQLLQAAGLWAMCRWRPSRPGNSRPARDPQVRSMLAFGSYTTAANVIGYIGRNLDLAIVGKLVGAGALGLYSKAQLWATMPVAQVYWPLTGVTVASFSRLQDDPQRYRHYVRMVLSAVFSVTLAAMVFLFIKADDGLLLLLGRQWVDAVPIFRILTIGAAAVMLRLLARWFYLAEGRSRDLMHFSFISSGATVVGALAGSSWGAEGVAIGVSAAAWAVAWPSIWFCLRNSPVKQRDILRALWRPAVASAMAGAILVAAEALLPPSEWLIARVGAATVVFGLGYVLAWVVIPGGCRTIRSMIDVLRHARRAD